ncbi:MAG TPA: ring-cleaving dioxygenase [Opitutaceae bacterium]|jgi:glyoxalase family protein|nr:ring-cleaving dioxygenase [Opitutaceae bacterium]
MNQTTLTQNRTHHPVAGIHHITAVASNPRRNIAFYTGALGLRLVKKTVNFDDPSAYHLYYGDESGAPGSIVTFFYWPDYAGKGRIGSGQTTVLSFSAPAGSLDAWALRLSAKGITTQRIQRFGEDVLSLVDPDGIPVELVAVPTDERRGWSGAEVPADMALRGLHTAVLVVRDGKPTETLLTRDMGYRVVRKEGNRTRLEAGPGGSGRLADVISDPSAPQGTGGVGTIHHIAWRVGDDDEQQTMQARLTAAGFQVSSVRDRQYFRSIYYRERGGILFEIATDTPGFAVDEDPSTLGQALKLPPQFESARAEIERALPALA